MLLLVPGMGAAADSSRCPVEGNSRYAELLGSLRASGVALTAYSGNKNGKPEGFFTSL